MAAAGAASAAAAAAALCLLLHCLRSQLSSPSSLPPCALSSSSLLSPSGCSSSSAPQPPCSKLHRPLHFFSHVAVVRSPVFHATMQPFSTSASASSSVSPSLPSHSRAPIQEFPCPTPRPPRRLSSQLPLPSTPTPFSQRPQWLQLMQPSPLITSVAPPSTPTLFSEVEEEEELPGFEEPAPVDLQFEAQLRAAPAQPLPATPSSRPSPPPLPPPQPLAGVAGGGASSGCAYDPWREDGPPLLRVKAKAPPVAAPPPPFRSKYRALPNKQLLSVKRKPGTATVHSPSSSSSTFPHLTPPFIDPALSTPLTQLDADTSSPSTQPQYPPLAFPPLSPPYSTHRPPPTLPNYDTQPWLPVSPPEATFGLDDGATQPTNSLPFSYPPAPFPLLPPPPFGQPGLGFFPPLHMSLPPPAYSFAPPFFSQPPFDFAAMMAAQPPPPAAAPPARSVRSHASLPSSRSSSSTSSDSMSPLSSSSPSPPLLSPAVSTDVPQPFARRPRAFAELVDTHYRPIHRLIQQLRHRQPYQAAEIQSALSRKQIRHVPCTALRAHTCCRHG